MASLSNYEVSIIIPVFNEVDNVGPLFFEIVKALDPNHFTYEVIFVDDGSTDGTQDSLKKLKENEERVVVVAHQKNHGQSVGLISGAKKARYQWIVTLDGDGQNDPKDIPRLFEQLNSSLNQVILGIRKKRHDNLLRQLSSYVGNTIRQWFLQDDCPDTGCSLKLFSRDAFLNLPHFNHLHRFLPALFKRAGYSLFFVPVNHRPRQYGVSKYGVLNRLFVGIHDLIGVRWLLKRSCYVEILPHED